MHVAQPTLPTGLTRLPAPPRGWMTVVWMLGVAAVWWLVLDTLAVAALDADTLSPSVVRIGLALSLAGKLTSSLIEAFYYAGWWRLLGSRIGVGRMWTWLLSLSLFDALAMLLPWVVESDVPSVRTALRLLSGAAAGIAPEIVMDQPVLVMFGTFGLLAAARLLATVWLQVCATGRAWGGPLALTLGTWMVLRVCVWLMASLFRGQSAGVGG